MEIAQNDVLEASVSFTPIILSCAVMTLRPLCSHSFLVGLSNMMQHLPAMMQAYSSKYKIS